MSVVKGVLILECLDESDPGSEGRFISHMLNLMEVTHQYIEIRTKQQLMQLLQSTPYSIIHITTHGYIPKKNKFVGIWTQNGILKLKDLDALNGKLKGRTVVSTACCSGSKTFRKAFVKTTGCSNYIAPERSPRFYNAIFFAHIFYHKYLILHRLVQESYEEYVNRYKNPHRFKLEHLKSRTKGNTPK